MRYRIEVYNLVRSLVSQVIQDELDWSLDEHLIDNRTHAVLEKTIQERTEVTQYYITRQWLDFDRAGPGARLGQSDDGFQYDNGFQTWLRRELRKSWTDGSRTSPYRGRVMYYLEKTGLLFGDLKPGDVKWLDSHIVSTKER
jgi:hypothetical protein